MTPQSPYPAPSDRYHRQMLLPGVGPGGQQRLAAAHAAIVGCGALGCASADLLARAGVGTLTLIDRDVVELTNLQRQTLFTEADARDGVPKALAAAQRLRAVNSSINIRPIVADLTARNIEQLLLEKHANDVPPVSILIDGADNFQTRYLINDLAIRDSLPYAYAGVVGTTGMALTVIPTRTPCLRCLFEDPPAPGSTPTCDTAGVYGPAVTAVVASQVSDALKILLSQADLVAPTLLEFDLWSNHHRRLDLARARRPDCPCCGQRRFEFLDGSRAEDTAILCGQRAVQIWPDHADGEIDLSALAMRLRFHGSVVAHEYLLRAKLNTEKGKDGQPLELTVFADGRGVIRGTDQIAVARAVYARYVGY